MRPTCAPSPKARPTPGRICRGTSLRLNSRRKMPSVPPGKDYTLAIRPAAQKEIRALMPKIRGQVLGTIDRLLAAYRAGERPQDIKPIKGRADTWRIDSGEYRILYEVHDEEIRILV